MFLLGYFREFFWDILLMNFRRFEIDVLRIILERKLRETKLWKIIRKLIKNWKKIEEKFNEKLAPLHAYFQQIFHSIFSIIFQPNHNGISSQFLHLHLSFSSSFLNFSLNLFVYSKKISFKNLKFKVGTLTCLGDINIQ